MEASPYYAMALILHPSCRTRGLEEEWEGDRAQKAIHFAKKLWERYRDQVHPVSLLSASSSYEPDRPQAQKKEKKTKEASASRFKTVTGRKYVSRPKSEDEFEDYCNDTSYDPEIPPLEWWQRETQQKRWPRLSCLALEVLSMPAMSAEPERIFSGGRRTMSWDRGKLSIELLEKLECQKSWSKQKFPQNIEI